MRKKLALLLMILANKLYPPEEFVKDHNKQIRELINSAFPGIVYSKETKKYPIAGRD